jgi:hypothetical protein
MRFLIPNISGGKETLATGGAGSGLHTASLSFITNSTFWWKAGDTPSPNIHEKLRYPIHIYTGWEKQQIT